MTTVERSVVAALTLGLGAIGLLLDFTGWYTAGGVLFALLGGCFALLMRRGTARRAAVWLNVTTLIVGAIVLIAF